MPGMAMEILTLITTYLNLTIDVVKVTPYAFGWSNFYKEVRDNETDTYALFSGNNIRGYEKQFDFTETVFEVHDFYSIFIMYF
jgi:hypothetical protein